MIKLHHAVQPAPRCDYTSSCGLIKLALPSLLAEVLAEEGERAPPCVGGGLRVVDFRARIVEEGVIGVGVDVHLDLLAERF